MPPAGAAAPRDCRPPARRIWKLTPEQVDATLATIIPGVSVADGLRPTLSARGARGFSSDSGRLDMSGPHTAAVYDAAASAADAALKPAGPAAGCATANAAATCVDDFLHGFGVKAFRRPLTAEEIDRYRAFFAQERAASDATSAMRRLVRALLMSPHFLFRTEIGAAGAAPGAPVQLTPYERAAQIAYTLSDRPPDAELWAAAQSDALRTRDQVMTHVRRLLAAPATAAGLRRFFSEAFHYGDVANVTNRDAKLYPEFTVALTRGFVAETDAFVNQVLWGEGAKLPTLLSGGFSFVDQRVAKVYGIAGVTSDTPKRVALPAAQRAGMLTQGSWLARLSTETDGHIVRRGQSVREEWLCESVPPPPANINAVPPKSGLTLTRREQMERHAKDPTCAVCHQLLDPIGVSFENYDALGGYRTMDAGKTIDAASQFSDATGARYAFTDAVDLSKQLARSPAVTGCVSRQLYQYAAGRPLDDGDACALAQLGGSFAASGGDLLGLAAETMAGDSFAVRRDDRGGTP